MLSEEDIKPKNIDYKEYAISKIYIQFWEKTLINGEDKL